MVFKNPSLKSTYKFKYIKLIKLIALLIATFFATIFFLACVTVEELPVDYTTPPPLTTLDPHTPVPVPSPTPITASPTPLPSLPSPTPTPTPTPTHTPTPEPQEYVIINSAQELRSGLEANLGGYFILGANLSLENWMSMGTPANPFTGRLIAPLDEYGNPKYIIEYFSQSANNLISGIDRNAIDFNARRYYGGIIGYSTGIIENILIEKANINIYKPAAHYIEHFIVLGAIVGFSRGTVVNCHVGDGSIGIQNYGGTRPRVGMLVGEARGVNSVVKNSSASGTLTIYSGTGAARAGGLVGLLFNRASVFNSRANVEVRLTSNAIFGVNAHGSASSGGLVAFTDRGATIAASAAFGDVTTIGTRGATVYAGGLSGNTDATNFAPADITRWQFNFVDNFATGNAVGITVGNAYVSGLIARISDNAGTPSDITIANNFSTGSATIELNIDTAGYNGITPPASPNHYVAGIVSRIQSLTGSIITIRNSFATGNITNTPINNSDNRRGFLVGRIQGNGKINVLNLFYYSDIIITGGNTNLNHLGDTGVPIAMSYLQNADWQQNTLDFNTDIWTLKGGYLPMLKLY